MPDPVIVRRVGDEGGQAIGMMPCPHEMVGCRLGCGIGAAGIIGRGFGKGRVPGPQVAEHLIGRDVMETERLLPGVVQSLPVGMGGFEQCAGAHGHWSA